MLTSNAFDTLLLIEDNAADTWMVRDMLESADGDFRQVFPVTTMLAAEAFLATQSPSIILMDLGLPDTQGPDAIQRVHAASPHTPIVILTGLQDDNIAKRALQEGAQDYLIKGQIERDGLLRALRYAVERKVMEEALFAEKERAQVTLQSIADAVVCTNILGTITFMNGAAETLLGWHLADALGQRLEDVFQVNRSSRRKTEPPSDREQSDVDRPVYVPSSSTLTKKDGCHLPIEESTAPIHDREGRVIGAVIVFRDVSGALEMARKISHAAEHDFLTDLPNRLLLTDRIDRAIAAAERNHKQVAVLFLDLDGFKHINDSLGHPIGDKLLKAVAKRLVSCGRGADTVSRQGGDEFLVLMPELFRAEDAASMAVRLIRAVAEMHSVEPHSLFITTSIGISIFPADGHDAESLIKNADTAMYEAKENGRHRFQFFKPAMNMKAVERQSIERDLRHALKHDELSLAYQPKINIQSGRVVGAEALLRWKHPSLGNIPPALFIPIAEACGLILPIGAWVMETACRQAKEWVETGLHPTRIAVNVSANEFRDAAFVDGVLGILKQSRLDPTLLELELTESALMTGVEQTARLLQIIRETGAQIALDDFGTGYSSLSYLQKFPLDTLKIDQSFVRQIAGSGHHAAIVTAIISMARSLKLRVVAEGVETETELAFLKRHSCDEAQGWFFSKAVAAPEFAAYIAETNGQFRPPPAQGFATAGCSS